MPLTASPIILQSMEAIFYFARSLQMAKHNNCLDCMTHRWTDT